MPQPSDYVTRTGVLEDISNTALPFAIWGFLGGLALKLASFTAWQNCISDVLLESVPLKSIPVFLFLTVAISGVVLLIFGAQENDGSNRAAMVNFLVIRPSRFGMTFSAVGFGILAGVGVSAVVVGDLAPAIMILAAAVVLAGSYVAVFLVALTVSASDVKRSRARVVGFILVLLAICLFVLGPDHVCGTTRRCS
ncbi:MAG: hypothetical protein AAF680_00130 [Pseudomonadota bacterium]